MTRERAIKILKDSKITYIAPNGKQLSNEALDMAIQSLSAEKTTINSTKTTITDGDLISRNNAIELVNYALAENKDVLEVLENMPSAEKTAEWKLVDAYRGLYACSNCKLQSSKYAFCPNCGAKMKVMDKKSGEEK